MHTRHPLLRALVALCASGRRLFTLGFVPVEVARCDDGAWYRYHFAIRACELDAEQAVDFACNRRLEAPGGWFAAEDVVCDAPWVIEEWPRGSGHYIDRFDDETGLPEAVRLERAR